MKSRWAKQHVLGMLAPSWTRTLEEGFMWIGGWWPQWLFICFTPSLGCNLRTNLPIFFKGWVRVTWVISRQLSSARLVICRAGILRRRWPSIRRGWRTHQCLGLEIALFDPQFDLTCITLEVNGAQGFFFFFFKFWSGMLRHRFIIILIGLLAASVFSIHHLTAWLKWHNVEG